ncbi:NUDIX hydrolase [Corticibacter populi]|uniref:NUDIX hydrolase n=1 Tax=Corticibacter populi TaxID=1550736 RepID=A0A3M6QXV0_9BURK|nr:NUDIX hydrolase [Corticibacter populi]RMX07856.1 NUDIX hydrolase [Corticibacter populi]RZS35091.1 ADP-ribose pyrophosphatase YjhB (NUDIX family) [Corticibacter populi]
MTPRSLINFCRVCGHAVEHRVPDDGDTRVRAVCPACHTVQYVNPLNVVGTIPVWQDQVLLCRRNIEPRMGKWTLPAGFMELDETTAQGAARETDEEAGLQLEMGPLFSIISVPRVGQVHLFYRATMTSPEAHPGPETQEARLFAEAEIPWEELAFHTTRVTLERFFADRQQGRFGIHDFSID